MIIIMDASSLFVYAMRLSVRIPVRDPEKLSDAYQSQMQVASVNQSNVYHWRREAYYFGART
jgi:hypothetical protein